MIPSRFALRSRARAGNRRPPPPGLRRGQLGPGAARRAYRPGRDPQRRVFEWAPSSEPPDAEPLDAEQVAELAELAEAGCGDAGARQAWLRDHHGVSYSHVRFYLDAVRAMERAMMMRDGGGGSGDGA